eukprot:GHUV01003079.1.p1 GENE.GHUV01003079.1~~GHUV01003079.1.p1  ORF type:complete len:255 (+),score=63.15 GHUV01003079.1:160-924(+)
MAHALQQKHIARGAAKRCTVQSCSKVSPVSVRRVQRPQQQVCFASKLDDVSLFADSSIVGGKGSSAVSTQAKSGAVKLEDIPLNSELSLDYSALRDYLAAGDVRKADDETRALLIKMAGSGAQQRGWVYFTEVPPIPATDLQTVDALWRAASNNKFGYSVQKEMWVQAGRRWPKFFKAMDWVVGENNVYRKWPAEFKYAFDAPKGHMPLTNALRGTQLFQAIMEHPAFAKTAGGKAGLGIDERSAMQGKDTLKF